ncbi:MAG: DUF4065 domain-containing protein [Propionibacteriaceae bacterium]|nr:DUF4065 domain-containing protein [Propionibacteriaceae bacterium]
MTKALDVLRYIKQNYILLGEVQYQKLLYYVQGWSLAWGGTPMFEDRIEAWAMGPVVPAVRRYIGDDGHYSLTELERATVDAVVRYYGRFPGSSLIQMTHSEQPWLDAREGIPEDARSDSEITHDSMRREFTKQSLQGKGPQRPVSDVFDADTDETLAIAAKASRRWSRALALMAE